MYPRLAQKDAGVDYWKRMCQEYRYVAIGGLVFHVKKQEYELIRRLVHYAAVRGVKVHGLRIYQDQNH